MAGVTSMASLLPSPDSIRERIFDVVVAATRLRFEVELIGASRLPLAGGALLVANRQLGISEPTVVALGVFDAIGRRVRIPLAPDVPLVGDLVRCITAAVDQPLDTRSLLAGGELTLAMVGRRPLLASPSARAHGGSGAGSIAAGTTAPALELGVPVFPVAVVGSELGRRWRVVVGHEIEPPQMKTRERSRRFAEDTRSAIQGLLSSEVGV
jgi:hypothetical protein